MKKNLVKIAAAITLAASTGFSLPAFADSAERYEHAINMGSVIPRYLSPEGFLDPAFPKTVAHASPYLGDFYGVQSIADISREQIIADLTPRFAQVQSQDQHSVTLDFKAGEDAGAGFSVQFYPNSTFQVMGHHVEVSHAAVSGDSWQDNRANIAQFIQLLEHAGLADKYLLPNPAFAAEQLTEAQLSAEPAKIQIDPELTAFDKTDNGVLLMSEAVHGKDKDAKELQQILANHSVDWLALEMLNTDQQADLDAFNQAKAGTAEYTQARQVLVDYFAEAWNGRAGPKTSGEENYYFQLLETAHQQGIRVVAIEHADLEFLFFRYGETQFGGSVRSHWWVEHLPQTGKGIVFGGGAHYYMPGAVNVQDFLALRDQGRPVFSIRDLTQKPQFGG